MSSKSIAKNDKVVDPKEKTEAKELTCGIVMPIAAIDGCNESHWSEVKKIIEEAVRDAGFNPRLVSDSEDIGTIQSRIVNNLYKDPVVVCDVSGKNPNVMFELGMRLAFDKAVILIKDDKTSYSFDTSCIEHLNYPRELRFHQIIDFKKKLAEKIKASYEKSITESNYSPYLKHFGEFTAAKIESKELPQAEYIIENLKVLTKTVEDIKNSQFSNMRKHQDELNKGFNLKYTIFESERSVVRELCNKISKINEVILTSHSNSAPGIFEIEVKILGPLFIDDISTKMNDIFNRENINFIRFN